MATWVSLSNFVSFVVPLEPGLKASPHGLSASSPARSRKQRNGAFSMVAGNSHSYSSLPTDLTSVIFPSLPHSKALYFKSAYNVQVVVDENEPEERLLNRFRREVMRAGVIQECKRRKFFENKQDEKKRKTREAAKRNRRRRPQSRSYSQQNKQEASTSKKDEDEEDNWDMPEDLDL